MRIYDYGFLLIFFFLSKSYNILDFSLLIKKES